MMKSCLRVRSATLSSLRRLSSFAVTYSRTGNPQEVYELGRLSPEEALAASSAPLGPRDVLVKILASPINPADINLAEGKYGISVPLPAVGGNEGVGVVESVGADVKSLEKGNWVVPAVNAFGTWRTHAVAEEESFIRIPSDIGVASAATLNVNPATAYRMLRDFVNLEPGDVVIQNGANSMVGLAVIQIAKKMGLRTINIVRADRPQIDETLRLLTNLGGDVNVPSSFVGSYEFNELLRDLPPIRLGLNCVGGDLVTDMVRALGAGATVVSYGGMSKRPMKVPLDLLAAKHVKMKGFWVSEWYNQCRRLDRAVMMADLCDMIRNKELSLFTQMHDIDDFDHALAVHMEPFQLRKVVLNVDFPDRLIEHDARPPQDYEVFQTDTV